MRFEVPQFIDVEDKIFGPLTWRQFVYLGGGVGAAVVMFLVLPAIVAILIGIPLALFAAALSFYPINNRPFSYFVEAVWNYLTNQRLYLWQQKEDVVYRQDTRSGITKAPTSLSPGNRAPNHKSITSLTRSLELQALQKPDA
jgi:hypothetical protein